MKRDAATLEKIIREADREKCVAFFLSSSEEERRTLRMLVEEMTHWVIQEEKDSVTAMIHSKPGHTVADRRKAIERCRVLGLCVLATGTFPQMKKLDFKFDPFDQPEMLCKLLEHLQVIWLKDWVEHLAEARKHNHYQCLIEAGLSYPPEHNNENYILGFLNRWRSDKMESASEDSDFLKTQVWKLFEVEGEGDRSLESYDKYCKQPEWTWAYRLKDLSAKGKLSRARLLDSSLDALARDFAQFRSGWFSRFHEFMEPTVQERIERTDCYVKLLNSTIPPTVAFALASLKIIQQEGKLSPNDLRKHLKAVLEHLAPVLLSKHKGTVLNALGLVEFVATQEPKLRTAAIKVAIEGLVSEIVQVQERILKVLAKYSSEIDDAARARMTELHEILSPSNRKRLSALFPDLSSTFTATTPPAEEPEDRTVRSSPLAPELRIIPIAGVDELVERTAYLLENPEDIAEMERVLDGLVRFAVEGPQIGKAAQPLFKRAGKIFDKEATTWELEGKAWCMLAQIIRCWLDPSDKAEQLAAIAKGDLLIEIPDRHRFFRSYFLRLNGVLRQILEQRELPLLSTPTHHDFRIDPRTLIERIKLWQAQSLEADDHDVVVALLRMEHEHRGAALASAKALKGELGRAIRYALGADEKIGDEPWLWIAAARARHRGGDDSALAKKYPELGPGTGTMPRLTYRPFVGARTYKVINGEHTHKVYELHTTEIDAGPADIELPFLHLTEALCNLRFLFSQRMGNRLYFNYELRPYAFKYFLSAWPTWREPIYAAGVMCLGNHTHWFEVADQASFVLLDALSSPLEAFHENARVLLNFGLSCPHADGRTTATNAFVSGINSGRLDPKTLGQTMLPLFISGLIHPARVRKSLDEVVRVSPKHRRAVVDYIGELLRGDPAKAPDNMVKLLELYHELLVEHDERVPDAELLDYLKAFPGGGRGAKLAKTIATLSK